ncbi:MAG: hypothetical protein QOF43_2289 [Gaiellaceae bacterium]|nr:hypothetical protein [Gaiellaceae bacterium]
MTTMTASATQVYSIFIRATAEQVWEAITNPEFTQKYFYGSRIESSFKAGEPYDGYSSDGAQHLVDGVVLEADPPNKLVTTWRALYDAETAAEPHSRVTWEIAPAQEGVVQLTVVHDDLGAAPKTAAHVAGGWSWILSGLKSTLETGTSLT